MIKNFKDIVILLITSGVLILLATIIIGDYWVALEENRPVDESVITFMKMSVTGLLVLLAVILVAANEIYISNKKIRRIFKGKMK
jgi:cytochrome bd-type quinol oxidase subunit 2